MTLKAPFPYFGGKTRIADTVWRYLGDVGSYYEPFFGSGAVLLRRPGYDPAKHTETINDLDGFIANCWRSLKLKPNETAEYADWPVNHVDLNARRRWLIPQHDDLVAKMADDPEYCDPKIAGWWIWAASCWIGSGLTNPSSKMQIPRLTRQQGVHSLGQRPHLADNGTGIHSLGQRPHLGNTGRGVQSLGQIPFLAGTGKGVVVNEPIYEWFNALSARLRRVRVTCGDWTVICGGNWQHQVKGIAGFFFDPPYSDKAQRAKGLYQEDSMSVAHDVAQWSLERGASPEYRIVIAGYYEEHEWLLEHGWTAERWKASGGYTNTSRKKDGNDNAKRETLFISPHCLSENTLF